MKRKPQAKPEPVVSPEILENAKRSVAIDRPKPSGKCVVCGSEPSSGSAEQLCWVCRRLKISAGREVEQQAPAQE
jgi:Zn finger protein HypA/HybF involved in hydrogenase expression